VADTGHWSETALRHFDPVAVPVATVALIILAGLTIRFVIVAAKRSIAMRDAYRLSAALPAAAGELAVIDDADHQAFAVPGRPGRIVISSGLLRHLDATQRRALLAHERAHLTHRHHLHHAMAHLAAAANPLLHRLPGAVALSTERWADECAAATCRRTTVVSALILAAIGTSHVPEVPVGVLAASATQLSTRVRALRDPAPRLTLWRVALIVALVAGIAAAVLEAVRDTERLFELAQAAYRVTHG
jgi:hypothetical protein